MAHFGEKWIHRFSRSLWKIVSNFIIQLKSASMHDEAKKAAPCSQFFRRGSRCLASVAIPSSGRSVLHMTLLGREPFGQHMWTARSNDVAMVQQAHRHTDMQQMHDGTWRKAVSAARAFCLLAAFLMADVSAVCSLLCCGLYRLALERAHIGSTHNVYILALCVCTGQFMLQCDRAPCH